MKITSRLIRLEASNTVGVGAVVLALTGALLGAPATASAAPDRTLLNLINQRRAQANPRCNALTWSPQPAAAADRHATDLATNGWRDSHDGIDGSSFDQRISDTGYAFSAASENQAQDHSVQGVVNGWMNSAGHKRAMLDCSSTQAGAASVWNNGEIYSVADFATPG
jgi:uncharacterized protein YkwD